MDKLTKIIGLAPSELTLDELRERLTTERERVRQGLTFFRQYSARGRGIKTPRKASTQTKLKALMGETGLSPKQILKAIELIKQQKTSPESRGDK